MLQGENTGRYVEVMERIGGRLGPTYTEDRQVLRQLGAAVKGYLKVPNFKGSGGRGWSERAHARRRRSRQS